VGGETSKMKAGRTARGNPGGEDPFRRKKKTPQNKYQESLYKKKVSSQGKLFSSWGEAFRGKIVIRSYKTIVDLSCREHGKSRPIQ